MNGKVFLKNILLFIMIICSCFFLFVTANGMEGIGTRPLWIPFTLSFNIMLLENRKKLGKYFKIILIFLSILNGLWFCYHVLEFINFYIKWNSIELDISYIYLIVIFITFFTSLLDIKKDTYSLNDILTMITTLILILIHYRYYLDKGFLHHMIGNSSDIHVLQNRYIYITQYYIYFIIMYFILFIHKKLHATKIK